MECSSQNKQELKENGGIHFRPIFGWPGEIIASNGVGPYARLPRRDVLSQTTSCLLAACVTNTPMSLVAHATTSSAPERLLSLCVGRRPSDWKEDERPAIDALIEEVVSLNAPWPREALRGKWKLAYLQPGPGGAGVDRRIPFPELPGNDSFQIFGDTSLTNVGELLGPALEVRVSGSLTEDDLNDLTAPKRFRADITGGAICAAIGPPGGTCAPLPIRGQGIFDGVYLDKRLRIGQNLNGGGARIVQVRVD